MAASDSHRLMTGASLLTLGRRLLLPWSQPVDLLGSHNVILQGSNLPKTPGIAGALAIIARLRFACGLNKTIGIFQF